LAEKQAQDRNTIEALTRNELNALAKTLKQQSSAVLSSTLSDIESELNQRLNGIKKQIEQQTKPLASILASVKKEAETLQALTFRGWLKPLALSLSLLLGICAGSWALILWLSSSIQEQLETRAALAQQIEMQQNTMAKVKAKTWGVEFHQDTNGRFLILPTGVLPSTGWNIGKRQAVRLGEN